MEASLLFTDIDPVYDPPAALKVGGTTNVVQPAAMPSRDERRQERSIPVAQEHRDGIVTHTGDRQIRLAVAVEVAHRHQSRMDAHREGPSRLEGAIAVAQ